MALTMVIMNGCASEPGREVAVESAARSGCSIALCGSNARLGRHAFHELHRRGELNDQNLKIVAAVLHGKVVKVDVDRDRLLVRRGDDTLSGRDLVGLVISIDWVDPNPQSDHPLEHYVLVLEDYVELDFLTAPGDRTVPAYYFRFQQAGDDPKPLCGNTWSPSTPQEVSGLAFFFERDRYSNSFVSIEETPAGDPWFNVACTQTAQGKLHLLRHTAAGNDGPHVTTLPEREALLKLIAADYAGTGRQFTVTGTPLEYTFAKHWAEPQGWNPTPIDTTVALPRVEYEAIWVPGGVFCMNTARANPARDDLPFWAEIKGEFAPGRLRTCSPDELEHWRDHGYAISRLPVRP
ncbi:MAG TPA: ADYC domain-containing protein [Kofleriaceae bacterium]|nr:ADYC domain-containing protein [Kofleriaceae bacterium]